MASFGRADAAPPRSSARPRRPRSASPSTSTGPACPTISTGIGFFDHMLESFARHGGIDLDGRDQGRPAHRHAPHGRGHRHRARPGGQQGAGRLQGHPPLRPRLHPDGRDPDALRPRPLQPPLPDLEGRLLAPEGRRHGHRAVQGIPPRLRHERAAPACTWRPSTATTRHHIAESGFKALARALRQAVEIDPKTGAGAVHQGRL